MATNKDPYIKPLEWRKHLRKWGKKQYWSKSRAYVKLLYIKIKIYYIIKLNF